MFILIFTITFLIYVEFDCVQVLVAEVWGQIVPSFTQMHIPPESHEICACVKADLGTSAKFTALFHKISFIQLPGNSSCIGEMPKLHTVGAVAQYHSLLKSLFQGVGMSGEKVWLCILIILSCWNGPLAM